MVLPNFLFIGTGKAGSTSLYYYLKQHPDVFMSPVKETNFFSYEGGRPLFCGPGDSQSTAHRTTITTFENYESNFSGVTTETAVGEVSPSYMYISEAPRRIKRYVPEAKMIAILRNPIDRAYSAFAGYIKSGREPLTDFAEVIDAEQTRIQNNWAPSWHYIQNGFYGEQLQRYFELFDREQLQIYLFEDWKSDALGLVKNVFEFIEVDSSFTPDMSTNYNPSGKPKNRNLYNFLSYPNPIKSFLKPLFPSSLRKSVSSNIQSLNLRKLPAMSSDLRSKLTQIYRDDILKLQALIDRDLTDWLIP